jgi:hypothetical protein
VNKPSITYTRSRKDIPLETNSTSGRRGNSHAAGMQIFARPLSGLATFFSSASSFSKKLLQPREAREVTSRADIDTPLSLVESDTRGDSWKQGSSGISLKRCTGRHACGHLKPLEEFSRDVSTKDRLNNQCKSCRRATTTLSRNRNAARLKSSGPRASKFCPDCKTEKLADAFRMSKNHVAGLHTRCRECQAEKDRCIVKRRQENRSKLEPKTVKRCPNCEEFKQTASEFPKNNSSKDGFHTYCKTCHCKIQMAAWNSKSPEERRVSRMLTTYGLTKERYEHMLAEQKGACAICRTPFEKLGETPHIDHDHRTGRVRGLLCSKDNLFLGYAGDDPLALAEKTYHQRFYLSKHTRACS